MLLNRCLIEWINTKAEMIDISPFLARSGTPFLPKHPVDRDKVHHRSSRAKLDQANLVAPALDRAPERSDVKLDHGLQINDTQHQVIDFANVDHGDYFKTPA